MSVRHSPEKTASAPNVPTSEIKSPSNYNISRNKKRRPTTPVPKLQEMSKEGITEMHDIFNQFVADHDKKVNMILSSLKDIQQTQDKIQTTMTFLSEENVELKNRLMQMELQSKKDNEKIILLESKLEDSQRTERKSNIEIRNVPLKGHETKKDVLDMINQFSKYIEVEITKYDIKDVIRTNKNKKDKSMIIVEFTNTFIKTDVLKAAKVYNRKNSDSKLRAMHLGLKKTCKLQNDTNTAGQATARSTYAWMIIAVTNEAQIHQLANK
ncbi:hypothetical protein ACJJTC_015791 [Scirpophaga incertulas]